MLSLLPEGVNRRFVNGPSIVHTTYLSVVVYKIHSKSVAVVFFNFFALVN